MARTKPRNVVAEESLAARREAKRLLVELIIVGGEGGALWPEFQAAWDARIVVPLWRPTWRRR